MAPTSATPNVSAIIKEIGQMPVPKIQNLLRELNEGKLNVSQAGAERIRAAIGTRAGVLLPQTASIQARELLKLMMYDGEAAKALDLEVNGSGTTRKYSSAGSPLSIGTRLDIPKDWDYNPHGYANEYGHNPG